MELVHAGLLALQAAPLPFTWCSASLAEALSWSYSAVLVRCAGDMESPQPTLVPAKLPLLHLLVVAL